MLPTPYTLAQMRAGWAPGVALAFRIESAGKPTVVQRWEVVAHPDPDTAETAFTTFAEDGTTVVSERVVRPARLDDLRRHAEFPAPHTTVESVQLDTPMGKLDGWRYTVKNPDNAAEQTVFEFAASLPGPPVRMVKTVDGTAVHTMRMTERTGPAAAK